MTAVGILWVVLTPYCTGLVVAGSRFANRLVTRHLRTSTAVGWGALAALFAGVFVIGDHNGMMLALASAPFAGLAVWRVGPSDDHGPEPPDPPDAPPPPDEDVRPSDERSHHRRHHIRRESLGQRRVHVKQPVVNRSVDQVER
jgi:hypothetical protein